MADDVVAQFKYVFRRHVNLNRIASICKGDCEVARTIAIRALRELADELEGEGGGAVVEWDPVLKTPVMKNRKWRQAREINCA